MTVLWNTGWELLRQMKRDSFFSTSISIAVFGYISYANFYSLLNNRSCTHQFWRHALGNVYIGKSETCGCWREDHELHGLSIYHCGSFAPYYIVFFFGNGSGFLQWTMLHFARIVLDCLQQHNTECQLTSWPPNSTDINTTEHILRVVVRLTKTQKQYFGISWICMIAVWTINIICLRSSVKNFFK